MVERGKAEVRRGDPRVSGRAPPYPDGREGRSALVRFAARLVLIHLPPQCGPPKDGGDPDLTSRCFRSC
jgi:hypothetical protein